MDSATPMVGDLKKRSRPYYLRRCKSVRARPTTTSIESLPNELLSDILLRVPADYLFDNARLVSRKWCHIICSREFVHKQVQHSTYGFLLGRCKIPSGYPIFVTATQGRTETRPFSRSTNFRYISSINGLCLRVPSGDSSVQIINPTTQEAMACSYLEQPWPILRCGIAYAAASMVYKVILPYMNPKCLSIRTVGVDNSWRELQVEHLHEHARRLLHTIPLVTEGFVHYVGKHEEYDKGKHVVTLDVETEILTTSEVEAPLANPGKNWYYLSTGRFLSMLVGHDGFSWEVWGMESRNREWSKVLPDIDLGDHKCRLIREFACGENEVLEPFGWVNYPEVLALCFRGESRYCIFYSLNTHEIDSFKLPYSCYCNYLGVVHKNNLIRLS